MLTQGHNAAHRSLERPLMNDWPYPFWIAHRGAGTLAPENTLAAFRLGASHGYRMFECDAKLSADGIAFLLHDDTLDRTTTATPASVAEPVAGRHAWQHLLSLDAGSWHSPAYAGEPLPTLEAIAQALFKSWFVDFDPVRAKMEGRIPKGMDEATEYRRLIEIKLGTLGVDVASPEFKK